MQKYEDYKKATGKDLMVIKNNASREICHQVSPKAYPESTQIWIIQRSVPARKMGETSRSIPELTERMAPGI